MDETDHVLVGSGAEQLARAFKLERRNPVASDRAVKQYKAQLKALHQGKSELAKLAELVKGAGASRDFPA